VLAAQVQIEALLDSAPGLAQRAPLFRELGARLAHLRDVSVGQGRFSVTAVDLNARLDVNHADAASLEGLFRQFTTDKQAEEAVAVLKEAPVARLGELAHLSGLDDSLALAVAPYLTVSSDGVVNINSAPERVLAALPGVSSAVARAVVRRREAGEVFLTTDPIRPQAFTPIGPFDAPVLPLAVVPTRLLIISRGWQDGHPLTHEIQAVYAVLGTRLLLQAWHERDL
jgi:hypothetical protein